MRLASFTLNGRPAWGPVVDGGVIDATSQFPTLKAALAADGLAKVAAWAADRTADAALDAIAFLPTIPDPGKVWCCGLNYHAHVEETGREVTEQPTFFTRWADAQAGHGQPMLRPRESVQFDYEGEIAVVIGRGGRRIAQADAARHIAGYACFNDGSIRDWQRHTTQFAPGKNFWRSGAMGPWMVTADEIPFGTSMTLVTRLNGQQMQRATTGMMIHSIAGQIAYVSSVAPLEPGDVIVTGTPGGVGARRTPPVWMKAGDVVEIEIDKVGVLRNPIADD
ncbi:MAG: fumarylacetoacetate hydrolase family protein [Burkholderiaceae bacterium]|jgi:2-keto-4-pentenoate hydratase/2-oxohepta-3-ene-1,7-dioic acid hydratase in catechol pathway|nr:fumarylacetoacetate hydrolase family protein [Burkholderiales bacterium]MCZ8105946.1 fumarylacetoacetate hydrolase family protein [Burkholderiales bacterium]MCZ8341161.1 fumarylacetoacetate hydrolase family protein [Burkholderiaceae bacterium]